MPFVPREDLDRLQSGNALMAERLREWEALGPFLEIAEALQAEVIQRLATPASVEDIGRLAYEAVLSSEAEKARDELAAKYEQEHRRTLYGRVLQEVETQEGTSIMESVMSRLETDPELATELRDSARKELTARAKGVIADHVTTEQQEVIDAETERQMELDRLDVAFSLTGSLDLSSEDLTGKLRPNDKLVVMFKKDDGGQAGLSFIWKQDVNGATGWVLADPIKKSRHSYYLNYTQVQAGTVPNDRFVTLGAQLPDLVHGKTTIKPGILVAGQPLAIAWRTNTGKQADLVVQVAARESEYSYDNTIGLAVIAATDLQTRDLEFVE